MLIIDELREFLQQQCLKNNLKLVKFNYSTHNQKINLNLIIENEQETATLEECSTISKIASIWLKNQNLLNKTNIFVSSPRIDRELFEEKDYEKFIRQEVKIELKDKLEGKKNFKGFIKEVKCGVIIIQSANECIEIGLDLVKKANLIPDWNKALKKEKNA